jgi:hypothetical protein
VATLVPISPKPTTPIPMLPVLPGKFECFMAA